MYYQDLRMYHLTKGIDWWPLILYTVYLPPLCLLYLIEVYVILRRKSRKSFTSSYYTFFVIGAVIDFLTVVVNSIALRLPIYPQVNEMFRHLPPTFFSTAIYFLQQYLPAAQEVLYIVIAWNRFTAVTYSHRHRKMWRILMPPSLALIILLPCSSAFYLFGVYSFFYCLLLTDVDIVCVMTFDNSKMPWAHGGTVNCVFYGITSGISLVIYIVGVFHLKKSIKATAALTTPSETTARAVEKRLLMLGMSTFAAGIPLTILQVMFATGYNKLFALFQMPWALDLKVLASPLLALVFSTPMRREVRKLLSRGKGGENAFSTRVLSHATNTRSSLPAASVASDHYQKTQRF